MTLDNLVGISLEKVEPDSTSIARLLEPDKQTVIVLDALRKQRNVADYSGDIIPESTARDCLMHAENLLQNVSCWLKANRPELMKQ